MNFLPWRTRKQIFYFGIFAVIVLALIAGLVWYFWPKPTCTDNRKNGGEEGIDCGGPCTPCLGQTRDLAILWTRSFKNREGFYDVAALVENPNLFAGLPLIRYQFKLYDADNVLITIREGSTFVNPGEKQIIFESNIAIGLRTPSRAYIEFEQEKNWKYIKKEKSFLSVVKKDFVNFPFPRVSVEIRNESLFEVKNVLVTAVLYDEEGNAQGVSMTKIDSIPADSSRPANFTWPVPFIKEPATIEIFATINLTVNNVFTSAPAY